ncbi:MAG: LysR family transcriptional regulator [Noviherbaspirillum sp.]
MWQIDPTSLRLFIAVCEERSIARASDRELMATAAVSKRIADMEAMIGTPLLSRRQRGVTPTSAGEALLRHAKHLMQEMEALQNELSEYASGIRGHVRLLANVSSVVEFLPEEIAAFLQANECIHVVLEERVSAEIIRGVSDGIADIGICRDFIGVGDLEILPYRADHFAVVVHHSHPLAGRSRLAFADTLDYEQIGLSVNDAVSALMRRVGADHARELRYRAHVSTFDAAYRFLQLGLGLAVLPAEAVERYSNMYGLRIIPLSDEWATRHFVICVRRVDALSLPAKRFLDHLLSRCASV